MPVCIRILPVLLFLIAGFEASASDWFPIETGRRWVYSGADGTTTSFEAISPETFMGETVMPRVGQSGSRVYYSVDGEGRTLLHGATFTFGMVMVLTPPIICMDSELTPGHKWESVSEAVMYDPHGRTHRRAEYRATFKVLGETTVTVPAGTFSAIEVLHSEESMLIFPVSFREAYVEGIGWVNRIDENTGETLFELVSYGVNGVSNGVLSWGTLKALYR